MSLVFKFLKDLPAAAITSTIASGGRPHFSAAIVADICMILRRSTKFGYKVRFPRQHGARVRTAAGLAISGVRASCGMRGDVVAPVAFGTVTMFGFLTQQTKDRPDPLLTPKSASAWLRQLPSLDVIGRQQHVMRAFEGMRQANRGIDFNRVAAFEFLDSALGADRRQLIKQYVENVDSSARLSDRLWQALLEMTQGFTERLPGGARPCRRIGQSALEAGDPAIVLAPHPLPRHRREASRVPLRALDPRQMGRAAPPVHARGRVRDRARAGHARKRHARTRRSGRSSRNT